MSAIINVVFPVFAIILCGYLAGRKKILGDHGTEALNKFVYWVALPALLFRAMANVDMETLFNWGFLSAYMGAQAATMILAMFFGTLLFKNTVPESAVNGMNAVYGNTGYMGIPLSIAAFGEAAAIPAIITAVINSSIIIAIATIQIEVSQSKSGGFVGVMKDVARALGTSPILIAPAAGILVSASGFELPQAIDTFTKIVGDAAGPCALFAIGLFLVGKPVSEGIAETAVTTTMKLLVQPLITWWLVVEFFNMPPLWGIIAILMAATPTGAGSFVLAQQYNVYVSRTSSVILISTILSTITLSIFFMIYPTTT